MVDGSGAIEAARALPVVLLGLLLLVSAWWDSAFDLRYWAPLTILALGLLLAQLFVGGLEFPRSGPVAVATAAIWGLAGYVLLTAAWSESAAAAWEEAARSVFYAALWTLAATASLSWRWRSRLGAGMAIGVGAIALVTLLGLLGDGRDLFLAGRLDSPVGYRNGTAALFAFAAWPLIGLSARRGLASGVRAAAFATAVLVLGLAFLTQSRGVLIGFATGGAVALAIGPDRLRRIWVAIGALGAIAVASGSLLTPYDAFDSGAGIVTGEDIRTAATTLALLVGASFVGAIFLAVFDNGLRSARLARQVRVVAVVALVVVGVGAGVAGLAKVGNPVSYVDTKIKEFSDVEPEAVSGSTRLGSVSGQRSDLWGVAWDQFQEHPLAGAGAGSFQFAYYRDRATDRNLTDTHSLPLRLLADLGLIGTILFAVWLGAAALAIARRARAVQERDRLWIAGFAAAGTTVLAQCLTDWLWLLPGLLGLSVLTFGLAAGGEEGDQPAFSRWSAGRIVATAALVATTLGVVFLFLGDLYVRKARVDALHSPPAQLGAARTAAFFNPVSVTPLYLEASALESEGDLLGARKALEDALDLEPNNFVTLGLLGDFEVRRGKDAAARRYYRQALVLNPKDIGLLMLSRGEFRR